MRFLLLLIFISGYTFSQEKTDHYYFSSTGDTLIYPAFQINDSTYLSISKYNGTELVQLEQITVAGFDNFTIPKSIIEKYNLNIKGSPAPNDPKNVFVREKVTKNLKIGYALDFTKYLYRTKIKISIDHNGKTVLKNYRTEQDYDALEKKDFSKETYFTPIIIKMDGREIYFVTLSPKVYHPDFGTRVWAILYDFEKPGHFVKLIK